MSESNASTGASNADRCGYATDDGTPCELPASRSDGRCHLHTETGQAGGADGLDGYDAMLADLDVAIGTAREKLQHGKIRDEEKEKVRIKWVRALAYAVNVRRQVTQDRDLEELARQVEELKKSGPEEAPQAVSTVGGGQ